MNIKDFCKDYSSKELVEIKDGISILTDRIINVMSSPDNISSLVGALQENAIEELESDVLELAICFLCDRMNVEVIERELFRREMEEKHED